MFKLLVLTVLATGVFSKPLPDASGPPANLAQQSDCSFQPRWALTDILYSSVVTYSNPAHLAVHSGNIAFNLSNTDVSFTTHCNAYGTRDPGFFYGDQTYVCDAPTGAGVDPRDDVTFAFSQPSGAFTVNATWVCGANEVRSGTASAEVKLECLTDEYRNNNWTRGEIYSSTTVTCKPGSLEVNPYLLSVVAG